MYRYNVGCAGSWGACDGSEPVKAPNDVWRNKMWVGRSNWFPRCDAFIGAVAGFRLHDRALTAAEVGAIYSGGIHGVAVTSDALVFLPLVGTPASAVGGAAVAAFTNRTWKAAMGALVEQKCANTPQCAPPPSPPAGAYRLLAIVHVFTPNLSCLKHLYCH